MFKPTEHDKVKHPGWTIKFPDDMWLTSGHGWAGGPASIAYAFPTKEEAEQVLKEEQFTEGQVVEAWEPAIARLQYEVAQLEKANTFTPRKVYDVRTTLEWLRDNLDDAIADMK